MEPVFRDPINVRFKIQLRGSLPEAPGDHKDEHELQESLGYILNTNGNIQVLEEELEVGQSESYPSKLEHQHNFVKTWHSLEILIEEVFDLVVSTILIVRFGSHVGQWVKRVKIEKEHG